MAIKVINTGDAQSRPGSAWLFYGAPKVGKTTLLGTLPEKQLLLIDIEGGRNRLTDAGKKHDVVSVKTLDELAEVHHELRDGSLRDYPYIALDSLTELERYITLDLAVRRKKEFAELKEFGDTAGKMREFFLRLRDLREQGRTVIFTATESDIDLPLPDGTTQSILAPLLMKKLARELCGLVDVVGRVLVSPKTGKRGVVFKASPEYIAGGRYEALNTYDGQLDLPRILATALEQKGAKPALKEAA